MSIQPTTRGDFTRGDICACFPADSVQSLCVFWGDSCAVSVSVPWESWDPGHLFSSTCCGQPGIPNLLTPHAPPWRRLSTDLLSPHLCHFISLSLCLSLSVFRSVTECQQSQSDAATVFQIKAVLIPRQELLKCSGRRVTCGVFMTKFSWCLYFYIFICAVRPSRSALWRRWYFRCWNKAWRLIRLVFCEVFFPLSVFPRAWPNRNATALVSQH